MTSSLQPSDRSVWLLVIIHLSKSVDGITRLHKLAFLTMEQVPGMERVGFYSDWEPSKYGPFSRSLASDVSWLIDNGLLDNSSVQSVAGYTLERFRVTDEGAKHASASEERYPKLVEMIRRSIVEKYARAP